MSKALLPIYNSILQYKKQTGDERDDDELVDELFDSYGLQRHAYYRFVLFPDVYPVCRPPMMFPYATHIFRDIGSVSRTASSGALYIQWIPNTRSTSAVRSSLVTYTGADANTFVGDNVAAAVTGEVVTTFNPPTVTGVDSDHVRALGAFISVTYIGRADEMSGLIEIGIAVDDNTNTSSTGKPLTTAQLKSCYQYKKLDVSEGCRCVWLPLQESDMEFYGASTGTTNNLHMVYNIHITGAPTSANVFRIDYGYYYDGLVDETGYNTLLPRKPIKQQLSPQQVVSNVRNMAVEDFAVTKGMDSEQGFASRLWNGAKQNLESAYNEVSKVFMGEAIDGFMNPRSFIK